MRALDRIVLLILGVGVLAMALGFRGTATQDTGERIASADVLSLVEQLLRTDAYADVRIARETELIEAMQGMQLEIQSLSQQLQAMQPGDPAGQQLYAQLQNKQLEAQQFQQTSLESFQQLGADQAKEVYAMVREAAQRVADREGFAYVFANRSGTDMGAAASLTAVTQEILARPMAVGADRHDLTSLIRAELGLPEPNAQDAEANDQPSDDGSAEAGESGDQPAP